MNYVECLALFMYGGAVAVAGMAAHEFLRPPEEGWLNRYVYLGESFLLGAAMIVGEMLLLSVIHLYQIYVLWVLVLLHFALLLWRPVREGLARLCGGTPNARLVDAAFVCVLLLFIFRNFFFLVDVDSHSSYLYAQRLWLANGTSLTGDVGSYVTVFTPHFDAVPYSLGIGLFAPSTLFAEGVTVLWRLCVLFLVFGYVRYRINGLFALAAVLFVMLNEHFFYSGANRWVIINAALIGFLFAASYNFWESRQSKGAFRWMLALVFSAHLLANKYQMVYAFVAIVVLGFAVQTDRGRKIRSLLRNPRWLLGLGTAAMGVGLWYLKNILVTGDPAFPVLAGWLHAFGWTPEKSSVFTAIAGGLTPELAVKYLSYLFIWSGVGVLKFMFLGILAWPFLVMIAVRSKSVAHLELEEPAYWISLVLLLLLGTVCANHQDPRYYRYLIAVAAFGTVRIADFTGRILFHKPGHVLIGVGLVVLAIIGTANEGFNVVQKQGGSFQYPTYTDNVGVILDRLHMDEIIERYFPQTLPVDDVFRRNPDKVGRMAWDIGMGGFPSFLVPMRPMVSLWYSGLVAWPSYQDADAVIQDLRLNGIEWIGELNNDRTRFLSAAEYAKQVVREDRKPNEVLYNYGFPDEISKPHYRG